MGMVKLNLMSLKKSTLNIDLVIPIFNEAGVVEQTYTKIWATIDRLPHKFNIYYVDDGSTDGTPESLAVLARKDQRIIVLELSRNFGHQAALTAGLDASRGDFVISMDGDGQHPPEMIPQMIELFEQGYDIIQAQRIEGEQAFSFKQIMSSGFYALINSISGTRFVPGAADFRGLSRQVVDALKSMPEYHRFLRGMISWMGYRSVILPYHETSRVAGRSKYSFGKMFRLAMDAIFSFSLIPLYVGMTLGGILLCLAAAQIIYVLSFWLTGRSSELVAGWSSLMSVTLVIGGMVMILLGFIGVYIGYIFQEVKHRPVYLLRSPQSQKEKLSDGSSRQWTPSFDEYKELEVWRDVALRRFKKGKSLDFKYDPHYSGLPDSLVESIQIELLQATSAEEIKAAFDLERMKGKSELA